MRFFHSESSELALPDGHRFPASKYKLLRAQLLADGLLRADQLTEATPARLSDIERAHEAGYVARVETDMLSDAEHRRIGFPRGTGMAHRARVTVGGALMAAQAALETGLSGHLAGGTHHAHYDFGSGYCVFNDFAVVALTALDDWGLDRVAIIDLDVHQGDGNAAILGTDERVFVFSMHGEKNFPFRKAASDLDVALPDGAGDVAYLSALAAHLDAVWAFRPNLVLYQAGVDPLAEDRLGRLSLSLAGLRARDRMVLSACARRGLPVSMAIGGGYADPIALSVAAYAGTYAEAKTIYGF